MTNPLISIIIPLYNVSQYVATCINSVLSQSYRPLEIILVDDASTDDSLNRAMKTCHSDFSVKTKALIHSKNKGQSAARNLGLLNSEGKYIFFLDSDDILLPHCISTLFSSIERNDVALVMADIERLESDGSRKNEAFYSHCEDQIHREEEIIRCYYNNLLTISPCNKLIKRNFLIENKIFFEEGQLFEDWLWCMDLAHKLTAYVSISETTYLYRRTPGSTVTKGSIYKCKQYGALLRKLLEKSTQYQKKETDDFRAWYQGRLSSITDFCNWPTSGTEPKRKKIAAIFQELDDTRLLCPRFSWSKLPLYLCSIIIRNNRNSILSNLGSILFLLQQKIRRR